MALISGRPISFQMDLYQPLYVSRPSMQLELFASLRPVAYSGSMEEDKKMMADARRRNSVRELEMLHGKRMAGLRDKAKESKDEAEGESDRYGLAMKPGDGAYAEATRKQLGADLNLGRSVTSSATASKLGDFFQYAIDKPVSLPRQKSALLPI